MVHAAYFKYIIWRTAALWDATESFNNVSFISKRYGWINRYQQFMSDVYFMEKKVDQHRYYLII